MVLIDPAQISPETFHPRRLVVDVERLPPIEVVDVLLLERLLGETQNFEESSHLLLVHRPQPPKVTFDEDSPPSSLQKVLPLELLEPTLSFRRRGMRGSRTLDAFYTPSSFRGWRPTTETSHSKIQRKMRGSNPRDPLRPSPVFKTGALPLSQSSMKEGPLRGPRPRADHQLLDFFDSLLFLDALGASFSLSVRGRGGVV